MSKITWLLVLLVAILVGVGGCPNRCPGPDPTPIEVRYELLSSTTAWSGTVRITVVVTNFGEAAFLSGKGQQAIYLYQDQQLVAQKEFQNLDVDGTVELSYEREWDLSVEFRPQSYSAQIVYDPDIFLDGNPDNDDCNLDNNTRTRNSSGLDALFGA